MENKWTKIPSVCVMTSDFKLADIVKNAISNDAPPNPISFVVISNGYVCSIKVFMGSY